MEETVMKLSPPLTVMGILIAAMIVAGATNPAQNKMSGTQPHPTRVSIDLPAATYTALTLHLKNRTNADGTPLTIARWMSDVAERTANGTGQAPPDATGPTTPQKQP
jgi:hypothetical protein